MVTSLFEKSKTFEISCGPVVLRPITMECATDEYVSWLNDPAVNEYLEVRFQKHTLESIKKFLGEIKKAPNAYFFSIHHDSLKFVGTVKLDEIKSVHSSAVVAYMVGDNNCWGKGVGTHAVAAACAFGIEKLDLVKIRACCYEGNTGSKAVLKKVGFVQEGCQRKQVVSKRGRENILDFGLLAEDFKRNRFPVEITRLNDKND